MHLTAKRTYVFTNSSSALCLLAFFLCGEPTATAQQICRGALSALSPNAQQNLTLAPTSKASKNRAVTTEDRITSLTPPAGKDHFETEAEFRDGLRAIFQQDKVTEEERVTAWEVYNQAFEANQPIGLFSSAVIKNFPRGVGLSSLNLPMKRWSLLVNDCFVLAIIHRGRTVYAPSNFFEDSPQSSAFYREYEQLLRAGFEPGFSNHMANEPNLLIAPGEVR